MTKKKVINYNTIAEYIPDQSAVLFNKNNILYRMYKRNIIDKSIIKNLCKIKNVKFTSNNIEKLCGNIDIITVDDIMNILNIDFYIEEGTVYPNTDYNNCGGIQWTVDFFLWMAFNIIEEGILICSNEDEIDIPNSICENPFKKTVCIEQLDSEFNTHFIGFDGDGSNLSCDIFSENTQDKIIFNPPGVDIEDIYVYENGTQFCISMDDDPDIQEIENYIDDFKIRFISAVEALAPNTHNTKIKILNAYKVLIARTLSIDFEQILEYIESEGEDITIINEIEDLTKQKKELEEKISKLKQKIRR
jgi:hypothetical protein